MLNVAFAECTVLYCYSECHYAECRYDNFCYAECHYAKFKFTHCRYIACHGTNRTARFFNYHTL